MWAVGLRSCAGGHLRTDTEKILAVALPTAAVSTKQCRVTWIKTYAGAQFPGKLMLANPSVPGGQERAVRVWPSIGPIFYLARLCRLLSKGVGAACGGGCCGHVLFSTGRDTDECVLCR